MYREARRPAQGHTLASVQVGLQAKGSQSPTVGPRHTDALLLDLKALQTDGWQRGC